MIVGGTVRVPGRQEHHPPRAAARRAGARDEPRRPAPSPRSTPAARPACSDSSAHGSRRFDRRRVVSDRGAGPAAPARRRARLRQLRHDDAPAARPARRPPLPGHAHGRRVAAPPADAAGHRAARPDGRAASRSAAATDSRSPCEAARWCRSATSCPSPAPRSRARCCSPELAGEVGVELREPHGRSRDHTERMLRAFGYRVRGRTAGSASRPPAGSSRSSWPVPGDPSSAAFLVGAAVLADGGELRIAGVGVNPTRTGFLAVLERMGAALRSRSGSEQFGEPVADLIVQPGPLAWHRGRARRDPRADRRDPAARGARRARGAARRYSARSGAPGEGERPARADRREPPLGGRPRRGRG